jgi:NAD(P)-dependent dehydrogenase (short-subunit alcohol dehydrogenase family)
VSLGGRVVLLTGTAGGMGAAAAELFAEAGATVVGCDIRPSGDSVPVAVLPGWVSLWDPSG